MHKFTTSERPYTWEKVGGACGGNLVCPVRPFWKCYIQLSVRKRVNMLRQNLMDKVRLTQNRIQKNGGASSTALEMLKTTALHTKRYLEPKINCLQERNRYVLHKPTSSLESHWKQTGGMTGYIGVYREGTPILGWLGDNTVVKEHHVLRDVRLESEDPRNRPHLILSPQSLSWGWKVPRWCDIGPMEEEQAIGLGCNISKHFAPSYTSASRKEAGAVAAAAEARNTA